MGESSTDPFIRTRISTFDLRHLRYAAAAADHGSFRQAAEELLVRQSTLSRCIRQLEEAIGIAIFERSSGGVQATPAGRDFLRVTRSILEQIDSLVSNAHITGRGKGGRLSVGFHTSLSAGNLRATLVDFRRRFPQVELGMFETSRTRLATALRNGAIDVAIGTGEPRHQDSIMLPLWSERILVAVPEGHQLATRTPLYWTDLRNETILISQYDPGRQLENLLTAKLVSLEDRAKIERHDVSRGMIKGLVSAGFGISLVTESDAGANFLGLIYRELRDGTGPSQVGYSAHWRKDNDNPALGSFLTMLGERYPLPTSGS